MTRKSQIIGVVIPDISHSFFSEITRGMQDVIEQQGYNLMLCHSHADAQRELQEIDSLVGSRVEGLIVASQQQADSPEAFRRSGAAGRSVRSDRPLFLQLRLRRTWWSTTGGWRNWLSSI